ncbi:MAG: hypothetical protein GX851_00760 [Clostridiales bacterium]|nr:hypothetical protein [Clostridiales bacterium]
MKTNDTPDREKLLIETVEKIRDTEVKKPYTEIDAALVSECVGFIMDTNPEISELSAKETKRLVKKIPFSENPRRRHTTKAVKALLVAALTAVLLLSSMLTTFTSNNPEDLPKELQEILNNLDPDESAVWQGEIITRPPKNSIRNYKNLKKLYRKEEGIEGLLFPSYLPEPAVIDYITVHDPYPGSHTDKVEVFYVMQQYNDAYDPASSIPPPMTIAITIGGDTSDIPQFDHGYHKRTYEFEKYDEFYICENTEIIMAHIIYKGNLYRFCIDLRKINGKLSDREEFVKLIEGLEEY